MIQIHNLKISAFFRKELISAFCSSNEAILTKRKNYFILGEKPDLIMTLYSNGSCNITNIKNVSSIRPYLRKINKLIGGPDSDIDFRIDNITASTLFYNKRREENERLELSSFCNYCMRENIADITKITFNNCIFPNCFIRTRHGTLILSSRRKCSMVGFKSLEKLEYIRNVLSELILNYELSFGQ